MLLDPNNAAGVLHRFYQFEDAVVARVELSLRPRPLACSIEIHAGDRDTPGSWCAVRLVVQDVDEFRFAHGLRTFLVLSFGVQLIGANDRVYVLLDAVPEGGTTLPDLTNNKGYVAGGSCSLEWLGPVS